MLGSAIHFQSATVSRNNVRTRVPDIHSMNPITGIGRAVTNIIVMVVIFIWFPSNQFKCSDWIDPYLDVCLFISHWNLLVFFSFTLIGLINDFSICNFSELIHYLRIQCHGYWECWCQMTCSMEKSDAGAIDIHSESLRILDWPRLDTWGNCRQ